MSMVKYGVSWLEWRYPLKPGEKPDPKAERIRKQAYFKSQEERADFIKSQVDRDDFLYTLGEWEENEL